MREKENALQESPKRISKEKIKHLLAMTALSATVSAIVATIFNILLDYL